MQIFFQPPTFPTCQTLEGGCPKITGINHIPHVSPPFMLTPLTCVGRQRLKYGTTQMVYRKKKLRMGWKLGRLFKLIGQLIFVIIHLIETLLFNTLMHKYLQYLLPQFLLEVGVTHTHTNVSINSCLKLANAIWLCV